MFTENIEYDIDSQSVDEITPKSFMLITPNLQSLTEYLTVIYVSIHHKQNGARFVLPEVEC